MAAILREDDFVSEEARLARIESDVAHIRSDLAEVKEDARELKKDVRKLEVDVAALRGEMKQEALKTRIWMLVQLGAMAILIARAFKWI